MTFENYLEQLDFDKLVQLWNSYCCSGNGSADEAIYNSIEELSDSGILTGMELTRAVFFGEVRGWYDKVSFNGYGNLYSVYDLKSSPIDLRYLAEWIKEEEHEVYQEWIEDIQGEFSEHLAANVGTTELYKLWLEYEGEPDGDETMIDVFDIEVLADDLIKDDHEYFQNWLKEQEDEAV
nr:MAG TPA: hypothetical protein [Caudoviricetes sp.]